MGMKRKVSSTPIGKREVIIQKIITFDELWSNYPFSNIKHNTVAIDNFCAINLSEALIKCGISIRGDCWGCPSGKNNTHFLLAQKMANWLNRRLFAGCPVPILATGKNFEEVFSGKKGIIFFKDYWQRDNEKGSERRTGDHIDLWDSGYIRNRLASYNFIENVAITSFHFSMDGWISDKRKSSQVLLWEFP